MRCQEKILYPVDSEALAQGAQRRSCCLIPGSVQGQFGCSWSTWDG